MHYGTLESEILLVIDEMIKVTYLTVAHTTCKLLIGFYLEELLLQRYNQSETIVGNKHTSLLEPSQDTTTTITCPSWTPASFITLLQLEHQISGQIQESNPQIPESSKAAW